VSFEATRDDYNLLSSYCQLFDNILIFIKKGRYVVHLKLPSPFKKTILIQNLSIRLWSNSFTNSDLWWADWSTYYRSFKAQSNHYILQRTQQHDELLTVN